ncbi:prepilin peptidase [Candidatus Dependentiae bacterium]|nr:MAG: prepilin peptidase [Candidatus Dependentiae bacterium]
MILWLILLIPLFLCWGSFLNVVAYRLIKGKDLLHRSRCIHCKQIIAWYDNIPLFSYVVLRGRCRSCSKPISWLYPAIELFTTVMMTLLYLRMENTYFLGYFVLFSALIVTIRSDLETMLISRWVTIALVPVGIVMSFTDTIPIAPLNSMMGAASGYLSLWFVGTLFYLVTRKEGLGQGDLDLLACIGAFTGIVGVWMTVLLGSLFGSIIGTAVLIYKGKFQRYMKLPFGPFLALGAITYVLFQGPLLRLVGFW